MKWIFLIASVVTLFVLNGCSSKKVFKPESVKGEWRNAGYLSSSIAQVTQGGAVLNNGRILTKNGEKKVSIPEENRLINVSGGWIITQNKHHQLELFSEDGIEANIVIELKKMVASASIEGDTVAILFTNNEMELYSLEAKKVTFKESSNPAIAVDARIANPYFLKELVLFLGLDGKVVIVNSETKQVVRSVVISSDEYFNNVSYLNVIENNLVAATGSTILALSQKESREKYDIRDIAYTSEGIWLTTKQGEVIALSPTLQFKGKKKFPFAHFVGISVENDRVYVLERQGYMIAFTKNLLAYDIYDIDMKEDDVFIGEGKFYFDDRYINIR